MTPEALSGLTVVDERGPISVDVAQDGAGVRVMLARPAVAPLRVKYDVAASVNVDAATSSVVVADDRFRAFVEDVVLLPESAVGALAEVELRIDVGLGEGWGPALRICAAQHLMNAWTGPVLRLPPREGGDAATQEAKTAWFHDGFARFLAARVLAGLDLLSPDDARAFVSGLLSVQATSPFRGTPTDRHRRSRTSWPRRMQTSSPRRAPRAPHVSTSSSTIPSKVTLGSKTMSKRTIR